MGILVNPESRANEEITVPDLVWLPGALENYA